MKTKIHIYTSTEPMMHVNAFIAETAKELVVVDTTLTTSDSIALKQKADDLGKPIAGIILTHGHPDHIAGTYHIAPEANIPIFSTAAVKQLMQDTEQAKHKQWSGLFGAEWIPRWIYPNETVKEGDTVKIAGLNFNVLDIGSGGDCDANSLWLLDDENKAAFIGDFIYSGNHAYMNDGSILRWLANIDRYSPILKNFNTYYVGHGATCDFTALQKQKEYFLSYCSHVLKATGGTGIFTDDTRKSFERTMIEAFPDYGCQFMVALSSDRVGKDLLNLAP